MSDYGDQLASRRSAGSGGGGGGQRAGAAGVGAGMMRGPPSRGDSRGGVGPSRDHRRPDAHLPPPPPPPPPPLPAQQARTAPPAAYHAQMGYQRPAEPGPGLGAIHPGSRAPVGSSGGGPPSGEGLSEFGCIRASDPSHVMPMSSLFLCPAFCFVAIPHHHPTLQIPVVVLILGSSTEGMWGAACPPPPLLFMPCRCLSCLLLPHRHTNCHT